MWRSLFSPSATVIRRAQHRVIQRGCASSDSFAEDKEVKRMLPKEIVEKLDRYIIGQTDAKKAVANALHNRWRREQLSSELRKEISPKNILMVGPSGVGKTEIARRLAKMTNAPFIKVEATKYTETGFHGADVDSIIKDLVNAGIAQKKKYLRDQNAAKVKSLVEDKIICLLLGDLPPRWMDKFRNMLREGALDDLRIKVPVGEPEEEQSNNMVRIYFDQQQGVKFSNPQNEEKWEFRTVRESWNLLERDELDMLTEQHDEEVVKETLRDVQERGIVFIDEIDKVCSPKGIVRTRGDASDEGVQRDLLPIVEGTVIDTKHGPVDTSKILFIASGAFYSAKPKDILPELQGRLPIRVSLNPLTEKDMYRILVEPEFNLVKQQVHLMKTEGITVEFPDEAVQEIARLAYEINRSVENIGARRLHTIMEKIMEKISYECESGLTYKITIPHIQECVRPMLEKADTSKYII